MADYIVIRLYPLQPTTGASFTNLLNGLVIRAYDKSFDNLETGTFIDEAVYQPLGGGNRIFQHKDSGGNWQPVATAVIPMSGGATEYRTADLMLTMLRNGDQIAPTSTHYNVQIYSDPDPLKEEEIQDITVISAYLPLPGLGVILDPGLPEVTIPTDGNPPNYYDLLGAINAVLAKDPAAAVDLTKLTWTQCLHIANELVWNRQAEPLPEPPQKLEILYTPSAGDLLRSADRSRFEASVQGYYSERTAEAEQLARYIFALSAALQAEALSAAANQVSLRYPIRPGSTSTGGHIKEADVTLT